jgi:hypothetical protein
LPDANEADRYKRRRRNSSQLNAAFPLE